MSVVKNEISYYRASLNAYSGINYALKLPGLKELHEHFEVNHEDLKFELNRYLIGFSEEIYSTGIYQGKNVTRFASIVVNNSAFNKIAIITKGKAFNNPVYITSGADINGDAITGKYGFSKQSIRNFYYKGKRLVKGKVFKQTNSAAPKFDYTALNKIRDVKTEIIEVNDTILYLNYKAYELRGKLPKKIVGPGTIRINGNFNNIKEIAHANIISSSEVQIPKSLKIEHSMIYSSDLITVEGKKENLQLISSRMIKLKPSAELTGQSLLLVIGSSKQVKSKVPAIFLEEGSIFSGAILYKEAKNYNFRDLYLPFEIKNKSKFSGIIYSPYGIKSELQLDGLIIFNYVELKLGGTTYQNYLKDFKIAAKEINYSLNFLPYTERIIEKTYEL